MYYNNSQEGGLLFVFPHAEFSSRSSNNCCQASRTILHWRLNSNATPLSPLSPSPSPPSPPPPPPPPSLSLSLFSTHLIHPSILSNRPLSVNRRAALLCNCAGCHVTQFSAKSPVKVLMSLYSSTSVYVCTLSMELQFIRYEHTS